MVIWDIRSRGIVSSFQGSHSGGGGKESVSCVRWLSSSSSGRPRPQLYTCGLDGSLIVYNVDGTTTTTITTTTDLRCIEVSGDGSVVVAGGGDASLRVFRGIGSSSSSSSSSSSNNNSTTTSDEIVVVGAHDEAVTCLDVDWVRGRVVSGSQDATLRVWQALW